MIKVAGLTDDPELRGYQTTQSQGMDGHSSLRTDRHSRVGGLRYIIGNYDNVDDDCDDFNGGFDNDQGIVDCDDFYTIT